MVMGRLDDQLGELIQTRLEQFVRDKLPGASASGITKAITDTTNFTKLIREIIAESIEAEAEIMVMHKALETDCDIFTQDVIAGMLTAAVHVREGITIV